MEYQILAVGLKENLLSWCKEYFSEKGVGFRTAQDLKEASYHLKQETFHLLVLDLEHLRSMKQSNWIVNIRYVSYIPIIILSDVPEEDVVPTIKAGADVCYDNKLPPEVITLLLSAQLRRYTEYAHFYNPESTPFQVRDIAIDPSRHLAWVRGQQVKLRPREFNLLLYFMRNPGIVMPADQISEHAWGVVGNYHRGISQPIYLLRQSIEPDPANPIYIKTLFRVGYYFDANNDETCDICDTSIIEL